MAYNWNWQIFLQPSATGEGTYIDWLLQGLQWTLMLSLSSWVIALLVGSLVGVLRTVPNRWLSGLATCYVEVFRNIPLLVQLFIWYFVLPELLPVTWGNAFKQMNPLTQQFLAAMLCLGLFTAARVAEQVRAGINSLPRGQKAAGLALGPQWCLCASVHLIQRYLLALARYSACWGKHLLETSKHMNYGILGSSQKECATQNIAGC